MHYSILKKHIVFIGIFIFSIYVVSCNLKNTPGTIEIEKNVPVKGKMVHAEGNKMDPNKFKKPPVVLVNIPKAVQAGIPKEVELSLLKKQDVLDDTIERFIIKPQNLIQFTPGGTEFVPLPEQKAIFGNVLTARQTKPTTALLPQYKDDVTIDLRVLDVGQGMSSSYIYSITNDVNGNIWFGTNGSGISRYDGTTFTNYTTKQGLSNNYVNSIFEDRTGNIWIGTRDGISKYDGITFTNYSKGEGLLNGFVTSFLEDIQGSIWFGTAEGLGQFKGNKYIHYTVQHGLPDNHVTSIAEDKEGKLWIGTSNGVVSFDGKTFTHYTENDGLSNNHILAVLLDKSGNLWFGTESGINKFDGNAFIHYTQKNGLSNNIVTSIVEGDNNDLWFGTRGGGVNRFDGKFFTHYDENIGLSNNYVLSIMMDDGDNLWIGTRGEGANRYNHNSFVHFTKNTGLSNSLITTIFEDSNANLWFGSRGGGVNRFDGEKFIQYTEYEGLSNNYVWSIIEDQKGNLWFGTENGVNKFDGNSFTIFTKNEGLSSDYVYSIIEDSKQNLWFGTYGGGVNKFDGEAFTHYTEEQGLSNNFVYSMIEDHNGNLWFGTRGALSKFDGQVFTHYTEDLGLSNNYIHSIKEIGNNNLWFASNTGINIFDGQNFTVLSKENGLADDKIWGIFEDHQNYIWVSTEKGINLLIPEYNESGISYEIHSYGKHDGLNRIDFYGNSIYEDSNNQLWLGSGKYLAMLDLSHFKLGSVPPKIQLNNIEIDQMSIDFSRLDDSEYLNTFTFGRKIKSAFDTVIAFHNYPKNLKLPHNINHLTFNFSAIDWSAPHKIKYQYKLDGLNPEWSTESTDNKADYRNIPYGDYTFMVRAKGGAQIWSEVFEYPVTIYPPWWKTWWFRIFLVLLSTGFVLLIVHWRTLKVKKSNRFLQSVIKERKKVERDREKLLTAMEFKNEELENRNAEMERFNYTVSHDLKSPLITIGGFIGVIEESLDADDKESIREGLAHINKATINMNSLLNNLLELSRVGHLSNEFKEISICEIIEEARFNVQMQLSDCEMIINTDGLTVWCDRKGIIEVFQNLLENAAKFMTDQSKKVIEIGAENYDNKVTLYVKDNGIGIKKSLQHKIFNIFERLDLSIEGTGIGLAIVKRIIEKHGGKIWVESEGLNKGTTFFFVLPKQPSNT